MSKIKEILCLHHSHLDVGYTHPQNMLLALTYDYFEQVLDLCSDTADWPEESRFRWTCEATYPLMKWLESAHPERIELFRSYVTEGRISVTALPMHTTPGCTTLQLTKSLQNLDKIRSLTGSNITTAINHDVNGQPWTLSSLLLDSNVQFYITGINNHFGGIPFKRPYIFEWETPDGRVLPSFVGEHYSLFNQFLFTHEGDTGKMHEGIQTYIQRVEESGWQEDFVYLTATNPPLYDNNCPDVSLANLIRRYNAEGHEQIVRFITPEMLHERIHHTKAGTLPIHSGDWTDYWNFGSASTAREVKINRRAKNILQKADFLECVNQAKPSIHYADTLERAYENTLLFDEHTWGSSESVSEPEQEDTYAQQLHKKSYAYTAAELSAYLLGCQMEHAADNPFQADKQEGLLIVNPTGFTIHQALQIPSHMTQPGRAFSALRHKEYLPYTRNHPDFISFGTATMSPFSMKHIPFASLHNQNGKKAKGCSVSETEINTPFYHITLHPVTGHIVQIQDNITKRNLVNTNSQWRFFDLVTERLDPRYNLPLRSSIFSRDVDKGNKGISQWQHEWKAIREGIQEFIDYKIEETSETITLIYHARAHGITWLEQKITFSTVHPRIGLDLTFQKQPVTEPEGIYIAFPLSLHEGWDCVYDTADTFVHLDDQQLGTVCRDYITVDKSISMFDESGGFTLACPDSPMVQAGSFQFGKENKYIERQENPLLLAWPLNNYWDTNFAASQEGRMSFHYELSTFTSFDPKEACRAGLLAAAPCAVGIAVSCTEEKEKELLHYESDTSAPIFIRPQHEQDGWLIAVKNFCNYEGSCTISIPDSTLCFAAVTDIQGNTREELSIANNEINFKQPPNAITFLRLCLQNCSE